jgi:ATP-dependent Clp protease protease subunit
MKEKMNQILSERTGQPLEVVARDTERDNFRSAEKAAEYGLIDKVLERKEDQE